MAQIFAVIVLLNNSIIPYGNLYMRLENSLNTLPQNALKYLKPMFSARDTENGTDYISRFFGSEDFSDVCICYRTYGTINGIESYILLYNKALIENSLIKLSDGKWEYGTERVYLDRNAYKKTGKETSVEVNIFNVSDSGTLSGKYHVSGILRNDIVFDTQPDYYTDFEAEFAEMPDGPQMMAIIPYEFEESGFDMSLVSQCLLLCKDGIIPEEYAEQFNEGDNNGSLRSIHELKKDNIRTTLITYSFEAVLGILLCISSVFGIGAYTWLKIILLKKQMGIYFLCGCPKSFYYRIILLGDLILLIIPVISAFCIGGGISAFKTAGSLFSLFAAIGYVTVIFCVPLAVSLYSLGKNDVLEIKGTGEDNYESV